MARAVREAERLNIPGRRKRSTIPTIKVDRDAFGKFAEAFARFMGTARFLFGMTVVIVLWVLWNVPLGPPRPRFDEYPFIFLTLILSLQASYAAPLILLAQNRQEARDRVALFRDRDHAGAQHEQRALAQRAARGQGSLGREA